MLQDPSTGAAEAVSAGHPDIFMDRVADTIVQRALDLDPHARVAVDGVVKGRVITLGCEITCDGNLGVRPLIERLYADTYGVPLEAVLFHVSRQSSDIAMGVDADARHGKQTGAGDQGIMFGYATDETPSMLPRQLHLCWQLLERLEALRAGKFSWLRSDAKSQVVIVDGQIVDVTVSTSHAASIALDELREQVRDEVVMPVIEGQRFGWTITPWGFCTIHHVPRISLNINPTGSFVLHGPVADAGEVGRKIVVHQYGDACPVGGGAFCGKDPTKVDRTAALFCRHVAVSLVTAGLCKQAGLKVAYTIGMPEPRIVQVYTDESGRMPDRRLTQIVRDRFDFRPEAMIEVLGLRHPTTGGWSYVDAARGPFWPGHGTFPWNQPTDMTGRQI